ncbi:MAG: hypothetical protein H7X80_01890, partial [bacterium]|nr:hypothetical protein [Candidatus Kapabacteria bacterium]
SAISSSASIGDAFGGANSDVFSFDGSYVAVATVAPGSGYWVSFPGATIVEQRGAFVQPGTFVAVQAGWNIIGCATTPSSISSIEAVGTSILSGPFDESSSTPARLEPGKGYWVEVSTAGTLIIH